MGMFSDLSVAIKADISDFSKGLDKASARLKQFGEEYSGVLAGDVVAKKRPAGAFKDPRRIVQGILVSKVFYTAFQNITRATGAVFDFTKQLEKSHIAYKQFFGDTSLVENFINVLKDFSADIPFEFKDMDKAAKQLLAYGFEYKNLMFIMTGVMNAAVAMGDASKIQQISAALGQINAKGRITGRELRRLAEAGIPVFEILEEKLGVTQDQLKNIANEFIPAGKAINAIVDGINERFGDLLFEMENTIEGLEAKIRDSATMIFSALFTPATIKYKGFLRTTADFLTSLRHVLDEKGIGGMFEKLVPEHLQGKVKTFAANLLNFWETFKSVFGSVGRVTKYLLYAIMQLFNMFAPVILIVIQVLTGLLEAITKNKYVMQALTIVVIAAGAAWLAYLTKVAAVYVFVKAAIAIHSLIKALVALKVALVALTLPMKIVLGLAAAIAALAGGFNKVGAAVSNIFKQMTKIGGTDPDKLFLPSQKKRAADLDLFNQRLGDTAGAMDDLAESTGKATRAAAKSLLTFDEVFKLNEPSAGGGGAGFEGFDPEDWFPSGAAIPTPEIPDMDEVGREFATSIWDAIKKWIPLTITSVVLGSLLKGSIAVALPNALAAIGILTGVLKVTWSIESIFEKGINWRDIFEGMLWAGITGAGFGFLKGGVGAMLGTVHIAAAGFLTIASFASMFGKDGRGEELDIKDKLLGALGPAILAAKLGWTLGGPYGAIIGFTLGGIITLLGLEWIFGDEENDSVGQAWGNWVHKQMARLDQAVTDGIQGLLDSWTASRLRQMFADWWTRVSERLGPLWEFVGGFFVPHKGDGWFRIGMGIVTGIIAGIVAGVWSLIVGIYELIVSPFIKGVEDEFEISSPSKVMMPIGENIFAGIIEGIKNKVKDKLSWIKDIKDGIVNAFKWAFGIESPSKEMKPIGEDIMSGIIEGIKAKLPNIDEWVGKIKDKFVEWSKDTLEVIVEWGRDTGTEIKEWVADKREAIGTWVSNTRTNISNWSTTTRANISTWATNTRSSISTWATNTGSSISTWVTTRGNDIRTWAANAGTNISTWATNARTNTLNWASETGTSIKNWVSERGTEISTWATNAGTNISTWASDARTNIGSWYSDSKEKITTWATTTGTSISLWATNRGSEIRNWATDAKINISTWATDAKTDISTWVTDTKTSVTTWVSDTKTSFTNWKTDVTKTITDWTSESFTHLKTWFADLGTNIGTWIRSIGTTINTWWSTLWSGKTASVNVSGSGAVTVTQPRAGHAAGGVFNREHVARFAEGNKAEAIIPLENARYMQPFVDAVADGLTQTLAPLVASMTGTQPLQPIYVGTLIADEHSLRELNRKMNIIQLQENGRRGR